MPFELRRDLVHGRFRSESFTTGRTVERLFLFEDAFLLSPSEEVQLRYKLDRILRAGLRAQSTLDAQILGEG
jgi:hypothetical protein